jgi:hypothetical protein
VLRFNAWGHQCFEYQDNNFSSKREESARGMVQVPSPFHGYAWPLGGWQKICPARAGRFALSMYAKLKASIVESRVTPASHLFSRGVIGSYIWKPLILLPAFDMTTVSGRAEATQHSVMEPHARDTAGEVLADCQRALDLCLRNQRCWHDWYDWQVAPDTRLLPKDYTCYWNSIRIDINHLQEPHRDSHLCFGIPSFVKIMGSKEVIFRMYNSSHSELLAGTPFEDVLLKPGDIMIFDASHWHEFRYTAEHEPAPSDKPTNGRYLGIYMAVVLYATLVNIPPLVTSPPADKCECPKEAKLKKVMKGNSKPGRRRVRQQEITLVEPNIFKNQSGSFTVRKSTAGVPTRLTVKTLQEAQVICGRG